MLRHGESVVKVILPEMMQTPISDVFTVLQTCDQDPPLGVLSTRVFSGEGIWLVVLP